MSISSLQFSEKVIVITGASSGIGASLAKYFAANGAKVVLAARRFDALSSVAAEIGDESKCLIQVADVTKRNDHEKLLAVALEKFGKVSVWINNAGAGVYKKFEDTTEEDLDSMMAVNVKSVLFGTQTAIKYFKAVSVNVENEGVVINVSSILGRIPIASHRAAYNASKHAVNSLTINARVDLQNEGFKHIHVLLFSPGFVTTEFALNVVSGPRVMNPDTSSNQTTDEINPIIGGMVLNPEDSADVYSRESYKDMVVKYLSAKDVKDVERLPPFVKK